MLNFIFSSHKLEGEWLCVYLASYKILRMLLVYFIRSLDIILTEVRKSVCGAMYVFGLYLIRNYCFNYSLKVEVPKLCYFLWDHPKKEFCG